MNHFPNNQNCLRLITGPARRTAQRWHRLSAALALRGPVRLLVFGNGFDPYLLAYDVARRTGDYHEVLWHHIRMARAETAHQMLALLQRTPDAQQPILMGDFLEPLHDEDLPASEADDLLFLSLLELKRLRAAGPVILSASPNPARPGLFAAVVRMASAIRWC
ncbi:MAG: hypothetical protein EPO32_14325 [Anaerolineae bacterium]|nr:MAG: hypothetical protein EPO32_14325 [Anaerolineae bacterium]